MPSQKPRIALTVDNDLNDLLQDLSVLMKRPKSTIITDILVDVTPMLKDLKEALELAEQKKALKDMKEMAQIYGFDISRPAKTAKEAGAKVIAFAGRVADDADTLYDGGIDSIFCILNELTSLDNALENGAHNLEKTVENVVRILALK